MARDQLLSSVWVRMVIFAWLFVFPIVFIALPFAGMFIGEREQSWTPVLGLMVWMLGPWAASVIMRFTGMRSLESQEPVDPRYLKIREKLRGRGLRNWESNAAPDAYTLQDGTQLRDLYVLKNGRSNTQHIMGYLDDGRIWVNGKVFIIDDEEPSESRFELVSKEFHRPIARKLEINTR